MRGLVIALVVFGAFAFAFAQGQTAPKDKFLPIVFDDWWNIDYVKNGCTLAAREVKDGNTFAKLCPSNTTPQETVKEFEDELEVAFASESSCHGLSLLRFTPEMMNSALKNPMAPVKGVMAKQAGNHWALMLDLDGHSHTQVGAVWTLVDSTNMSVLNGHVTTPHRVVQQVCKIAKRVGGKIGN